MVPKNAQKLMPMESGYLTDLKRNCDAAVQTIGYKCTQALCWLSLLLTTLGISVFVFYYFIMAYTVLPKHNEVQ